MFDKLTKRQKEVFDYVMCGFSSKEIARLLFLSQGRIGSLVNNLYDKYSIDTKPFRVRNRLQKDEYKHE
jgi:DNA-binding NarL/FixJ family response regulator